MQMCVARVGRRAQRPAGPVCVCVRVVVVVAPPAS